MTKAIPVPTTPRVATAAAGPRPGSPSGAVVKAIGSISTAAAAITSPDIATGASSPSRCLTMNPPIA